MLPKNILIITKLIILLLIIFLLASLFSLFFTTKTQASYDSKFKNYPGYEELLKELQKKYPNWEFELYDTGVSWSEAIIEESTGHHNLNQVSSSSGSAWKCSCGKGGAGWVCASTAAVAYYMDPRNSLNEDYIFQFEQLTYDSDIQTKTGVETILSDCDYMQGKITYYDTKGKKKTIDKTYVDVIMEAAKKYNISPYHLASRIRQEQGTTGSTAITGTWSGYNGAYKGYYNYFNVGAFGADTETEVMKNCLEWAKNKGWTDPEKAIMGGAATLANDYISSGQDTLYFQKFDVVPEEGYYVWQYMQNVAASKNEGEAIREAYRDMGMLTKSSKIKFKIPVYDNMPEQKAAMPGMEKIVTQDVQINANDVCVRNGKGTNYTAITTLKKGTKILRIELDNSKDSSGRYWDKVVLNDGRKGYISREYLTQISLQSNCNETYIVSDYTNFRNGPGTKGNITTTIIKLLSPGQILTVVEKGKYENVDGEKWYRVKLSDGTYGYVGAGYIEPYNPDTSEIDKVKVVCSDGINIRRKPTTNSDVLKAVAKGTILTRTEKNVKSSDTKYIWDKVTTSSGVVGYVVREDPDTKKAWIEPLNDDSETETVTNGFRIDGTSIICEPNIKVSDIKKEYENAVIKNGKNTVANNNNVGTGYTATIDNKNYTVIVLGDANGDGKIDSSDYVRVKNGIRGKETLTSIQKKGADANSDGKVDSSDYVKIKNFIRKKEIITVK